MLGTPGPIVTPAPSTPIPYTSRSQHPHTGYHQAWYPQAPYPPPAWSQGPHGVPSSTGGSKTRQPTPSPVPSALSPPLPCGCPEPPPWRDTPTPPGGTFLPGRQTIEAKGNTQVRLSEGPGGEGAKETLFLQSRTEFCRDLAIQNPKTCSESTRTGRGVATLPSVARTRPKAFRAPPSRAPRGTFRPVYSFCAAPWVGFPSCSSFVRKWRRAALIDSHVQPIEWPYRWAVIQWRRGPAAGRRRG